MDINIIHYMPVESSLHLKSCRKKQNFNSRPNCSYNHRNRLCKATVSNDHNDPVGICSVLASTLLVHCSRKISCRCNCSICCSTLFRSSAYLPKLPKSTELWDELQKSVGNKVKIFQCLQKPRLKVESVKSVKSVQFAALNTYNLQIGMLTI